MDVTKRLLVSLSMVLGLMISAPNLLLAETDFPPRPAWQPEFKITNDLVEDRMSYYLDDRADFVIFQNGTTVVLPEGLNDAQAIAHAKRVLDAVYNFHPDFHPMAMDDGNLLIKYNHPAYNIVIDAFAEAHMDKIESQQANALAKDEVIIGPEGTNKFDPFLMKALYGRTFMFMDGHAPIIERIYRRKKELD